MKREKSFKIAESAVLIALASILSIIALVKLPYGGTITLFSLVPMLIISYRHGTSWGLFSGLAFGFIQMLLGFDNLAYATSLTAQVSIVLVDYLIAFTILGFGGVFKNKIKNQSLALGLGATLTCFLRYLCHVFVGATVWAGLSIPNAGALAFSAAYNATYMIPETIITVFGIVMLSKVFDLEKTVVTRKASNSIEKKGKRYIPAFIISLVGKVGFTAAMLYDVRAVFSKIQGEGGFNIANLSEVDWQALLIVTLSGVGLMIATVFAAKKMNKNTVN